MQAQRKPVPPKPLRFEAIRYGALEPETPLWRYLTPEKLASLLRYQALWFSKLDHLEECEGIAPPKVRARLQASNEAMMSWFAEDELRAQVKGGLADNERSGRELWTACCWSANDPGIERMWREYADSPQAVAVQTTAVRLGEVLPVIHPRHWHLGRVSYYDDDEDSLTLYQANQAHVRAFWKRRQFAWENEVRVCTMNFVTPGMLNADGSLPNDKQRRGFVYDTGRRGVMARVNLLGLIQAVHASPCASPAHKAEIRAQLKCLGLGERFVG